MDNNKSFKISFGALAEPIKDQLDKQGFKYDLKEVQHFEKLKESLIYIRFADLLVDSQYDKAIQKFFKKIERHILKVNKLKKAS